MPVTYLTILNPSDEQVSRLFRSAVGEQAFTVQLIGARDNVTSDSQQFGEVLEADARMIGLAQTQYQSMYISFYRNKAPSPETLHQDSPSVRPIEPIYSTIVFNYTNNNVPSTAVVIHLNAVIQSFLKAEGLLPRLVAGISEPEFSTRELAFLSAIQGAAADQVARVDRLLSDVANRLDERERAIDQKFEARKSALEAEVERQRTALDATADDLAKRQRELDDRDNTHARRAIRGELIESLRTRQESFEIASHTRKLRTPIHVVFIVLLAFTLGGAAWSLYVWGISRNDTWGPGTLTSALKSIGFSFGFLTSAGLYISWMNRWFDRNTDAQFQTKQIEIDFNRASWAVEAALEWKGSQGEEMPQALLAGVTKHLFDTRTGESADYSPLEALASSLLGAASNLKMNMGGSEMSFDRKSLKELKSSEPKG